MPTATRYPGKIGTGRSTIDDHACRALTPYDCPKRATCRCAACAKKEPRDSVVRRPKGDEHVSGGELACVRLPGTLWCLHPELIDDIGNPLAGHPHGGGRDLEVQVRHVRISGNADARQDIAAADLVASLHAQATRLQMAVVRELSAAQVED